MHVDRKCHRPLWISQPFLLLPLKHVACRHPKSQQSRRKVPKSSSTASPGSSISHQGAMTGLVAPSEHEEDADDIESPSQDDSSSDEDEKPPRKTQALAALPMRARRCESSSSAHAACCWAAWSLSALLSMMHLRAILREPAGCSSHAMLCQLVHASYQYNGH